MTRWRAAALGGVFLAASLNAQHREAITVEVVDVPVYVHRASQPVENLTRERFELFVDGKRQAIEYFDVVDLGAENGAAEGGGAPLRERRLFLFLFDLAFSRPHALARAQKAAAELVTSTKTADAFAVASYTSNKGVQFVLPFTGDRAAVVRAIAQLRPTTADDPLRLRITESEREAITGFMQGGYDDTGDSGSGRGTRGDAMIEDPRTAGGEAMNDARKQPIRRLVENQVLEFGAIAERVSQLEGYKHIVVFSEGFNPYIVHDMRRDLGYQPPQANSALIDAIQKMYKRFQASDTFLHALDINGLRHTFDPLVNEALNMLSNGTGGQFLHNTNRLGELLADLSDTHRYAYVLGFTPRELRAGHHRIEVKVKDLPRGTELSYRRGFSTDRAPRALDGLLLADIILNDVPQTGVSVQLAAAGEVLRVAVPASSETVEVMLYVFDASDVVVASRHLRVPPSTEAKAIDVKLALPAGEYVAKALTRIGGSLGFTRIALAR